jgi:hypothetical protein
MAETDFGLNGRPRSFRKPCAVNSADGPQAQLPALGLLRASAIALLELGDGAEDLAHEDRGRVSSMRCVGADAATRVTPLAVSVSGRRSSRRSSTISPSTGSKPPSPNATRTRLRAQMG